MTTQAQSFAAHKDANEIMSNPPVDAVVDQNWDAEETAYTFADNSQIVVSGSFVSLRNAE